MKSTEKKEAFVQMRAEGMSYHDIAKTLAVCKQTLIDWNKDLCENIQNLKAIRLDALYEQYALTKEARIKVLGEVLERIKSEISKRDLSDVSTERLFDLFLKMHDAHGKERESLNFLQPPIMGRGLDESSPV
jgi:transposase